MKKSSRVSLSGMMCALSILFMFLTGVFPYATYALPALAGMTLIVIVIEINKKWALIAYIAVALLSLLISPDRMAALLFICFFGYYPVVKSILECKLKRVGEWVSKLAVFNAALTLTYILLKIFVPTDEVLQLAQQYSTWILIGGILILNVVFVIYDIAVSRVITAYIHWFRPKYLKKSR